MRSRRGRETDGEVEGKDITSHRPTPEDPRLREVYGYWVHTNNGGHLSGGIGRHDFADFVARNCRDAGKALWPLGGKVGRRFVR